MTKTKNGKRVGKPTAKTKTNVKPKTKAAKPTAEAMSDQERQRLLFAHKRKIKPLMASRKEADDELRKAFDLAKAEGITKKEIEHAIAFESAEGLEKQRQALETMTRVARWMGVGKQLDLFAGGKPNPDQYYEDGRIAALNDQPRKAPMHLSQKAAQQWMEGHAAGCRVTTETRANGFKPLAAAADGVVDDLAERAGIAGSLASGADAVDSLAAH